MSDSLRSLVASGTKLWLDSIDPDLVVSNKALGATGATSNPVIVSDLIKTGRFDGNIERLMAKGLSDNDIAWQLTDELVRKARPRQAIHRAGQEVVGGTQKPHDQGTSDAGGTGRAGGAVRGRHYTQRDADLLAAAI